MENSHQLVLETIQSLHKIFRIKNQESRIKIHLSWFVVLLSFNIYTQNNSSLPKNIKEEDKIKFQEFFFEALTQKAIKNYQNAIENLEECNLLITNDKGVLFELSKNHTFLNNLTDAMEFAELALQKDPNNIWILEHIVNINKKSRNFTRAIQTQKTISKLYPKKKQKLVYLHIQNNDPEAAKKLLNELEKEKMLTSNLKRLQLSLLKKKVVKDKKTNSTNTNLENQFNNQKTFSSLQLLLEKLDKNNNIKLLDYSEKGMTLFPAQPIVYLMNGKALNKNKTYKKAIISLENGLDFIIDNNQLTKMFYHELIKSYEGLGNTKNVEKYKKMIK